MENNAREIVVSQLNKRRNALDNINVTDFGFIVDLLAELLAGNRTLFLAGNGGSAATAQHFAVDIGVGSLASGNALKTISLVDSAPILTASANDYGYDEIFSRQLKLLAKPNDLLILISASGNSQNLLNANKVAIELGLTTLSFTGFDGGRLKGETTYNLHIPTSANDYGLVEDLHSCLFHILTDCMRNM